MSEIIEKERTGLIYMAINKINGKKYIGQTMHSIEFRKKQHIYDSVKKPRNAPVFYSAIRKYGISNFEWEILENDISLNDIDSKEVFFIKDKNSRVPQGYNITKGGASPHFLSQETKNKISKTLESKNIGPHKDKDWLYNKYINEEYSLKDISEIIGCSKECIRDILKKFEIPIRSPKIKTKRAREATSLDVLSRRKNCLYRDENWLKNQYIVNEFSAEDMAKIANCKLATILSYLKKYNIKTRDKKQYTENRKNKVSESNFKNKDHMNITKEWLCNKYLNEYLSMSDISKIAKCSSSHIKKKIIEFDIKIRNNSFLSDKKRKSIIENHKSKNKLYKNKEWIFNKYVIEEYSCEEISKIVKTDKKTISKYLKKFNIDIRKGGMNTQRSINKRYNKAEVLELCLE